MGRRGGRGEGGEGDSYGSWVDSKHSSFPRAKRTDRQLREKGHQGWGLQPRGAVSTLL